jgi:hypothetical protein
MNEQFGFRLTYFKNGFPMSSLVEAEPSGDFLFQRFFSEYPRFIDFDNKKEDNGYYSGVISGEFGINHTENLKPCYNYDIKRKTLEVHGYECNSRYQLLISTKISAKFGMTQTISIKNKMSEYPISLEWKRMTDTNLNLLPELFENNLENANVWNYPADSQQEFVQFNIELESYRQKLQYLKQFTEECWNDLNIEELDAEFKTYQLKCENPLYNKLIATLQTNLDGLTTLVERETITKKNVTYSLLINDYLYFVLRTEEIRR